MTFADLEMNATFKFWPGYIVYRKISATHFETVHTTKKFVSVCVDLDRQVIEV